MSVWWWIPIGLGLWLVAGLLLGLLIGPVLRRSSQTMEQVDASLDMDVQPCQEASCHC
jgi:uncharacterized membrane-anchored protein YhcB (DUF1043 family)